MSQILDPTPSRQHPLDSIFFPNNGAKRTCHLRVDIDDSYLDRMAEGKAKYELEFYRLSDDIKATQKIHPYHSIPLRLEGELPPQLNASIEVYRAAVLYMLGGSLASSALTKSVGFLAGKKHNNPKKMDKSICKFLLKNEIHLQIRCNSNRICWGAVEEIHRIIRRAYKHSRINYPSPHMLDSARNPIPTLFTKTFEDGLGTEQTKPFLLVLQIDGFREDEGIAGFIFIHSDENLPVDMSNPPTLTEPIDVEALNKVLYPWAPSNR
jgi:hypothetical protein